MIQSHKKGRNSSKVYLRDSKKIKLSNIFNSNTNTTSIGELKYIVQQKAKEDLRNRKFHRNSSESRGSSNSPKGAFYRHSYQAKALKSILQERKTRHTLIPQKLSKHSSNKENKENKKTGQNQFTRQPSVTLEVSAKNFMNTNKKKHLLHSPPVIKLKKSILNDVSFKQELAAHYYTKEAYEAVLHAEKTNAISDIEYRNLYVNHISHTIENFDKYDGIRTPPNPMKSYPICSKREQNKDRLTLLFDMDETLLHSDVVGESGEEIQMEMWGQDVTFSESAPQMNIKVRPNCYQILSRLKETCEIGVITAAEEEYAREALKVIDPNEQLFDFLLFRNHCSPALLLGSSQTLYVKDLRCINNRDLSRMVLIDNSPHTYLFQKENAIPIPSFYCDRQDRILNSLEKFIHVLQRKVTMTGCDVRDLLRNYFKLHEYQSHHSLVKLIKKLYR